ncbi:MAG: AGE family epimerase/isomerase [Clostridia bacterium]|nr:AGE family epimerase/isomerase [Clostridia bacterium]
MNFKKDLIENILPFWLDNAIDNEEGGIFTCLDREGNVYGEEKSGWFQGRALWTFSKAYNLIDKNPKYLDAAKRIYDFLIRTSAPDGRMAFLMTRNGRVIQQRRYFGAEKFAVMGCAEYYKASGDKTALLNARKYFNLVCDLHTGKYPTTPKYNPETRKTYGLSEVMSMLWTAQVMRAIDTEYSERYAGICKACVDSFLTSGLLTDKALLESVSVEGEFRDTPDGRIVNPGHSLEMAWFMMMEGALTDNREAIEIAKKIIDITLPLGLDKKHGGIIAFTDADGKPPMQLEWDMKLWWPQCETLIAMRLAYIMFGDEKYKKIYEELLKYVEKHFVDKEHGEWYGYLHYDNTVANTLKGNVFKGPFHIPRFYMIMTVLDECGDITKYM